MKVDVSELRERVSHPGKFEAQHIATPYYWDAVMNSDGEEIYAGGEIDGEGASVASLFLIYKAESVALGLPFGHTYMVIEDSQGFVIGSLHSCRDDAVRAFETWVG